MTPLAIPQARIPIGWAMFAGQRVPVEIDIEWMRAFVGLLDRGGGVVGIDFNELIEELSAAPVPAEAIAAADPLMPAVQALAAPETPQDARIEALQAAVAQLQAQINDLQQGPLA